MTFSRRVAEAVAVFDDWAAGWSNHYKPGGRMVFRTERFTRALAAEVARGSKVLDFGCGTGEITRALHRRGWIMTGCDAAPGMVRHAASKACGVDWHVLPSTTQRSRLPFGDGVFDALISSSVLEYLVDVQAHLSEFRRILKPGGIAFVTVPNPEHPRCREEAKLIRLARCEPIWWIARRTRWAGYFRYLRVSVNRGPLGDWCRMFQRAGFSVDDPGTPTRALAMLVARTRA